MSYIDFVKEYAKKNNMSFKEAMKKASAEYEKKVGKGEGGVDSKTEQEVKKLSVDVKDRQRKREKSARKIQKVAKKYNKKKINRNISKNITKKKIQIQLRAKRTPNKSRRSSGRGAVINESAGRQRPFNRRRSQAGKVLRSKGCGYGEGKNNPRCKTAGRILAEA